jgi:hypothetical protein
MAARTPGPSESHLITALRLAAMAPAIASGRLERDSRKWRPVAAAVTL